MKIGNFRYDIVRFDRHCNAHMLLNIPKTVLVEGIQNSVEIVIDHDIYVFQKYY